MKAIVKFEFYSRTDLESHIEQLNKLKEDHIKASGCKEPERCDELRDLEWLLMKFEELKEKYDNMLNSMKV